MTSSSHPSTVYHYTSIDAMLSIIATRSVWATAVSYLNDASERTYVVNAVTERLLAKGGDDVFLRALEHSSDSQSTKNTETKFAREQFVSSFSTNDDSLMHWRAYCPNQAGVAIGFRTDALRKCRTPCQKNHYEDVKSIFFGNVKYLDAVDTSRLDEIIARVKASVSRTKQNGKALAGARKEDALRALQLHACTYKHFSFHSEEEYRLLVGTLMLQERDLSFRTVRSTLIPYVPLLIPSILKDGKPLFQEHSDWNGVTEVVVGPSANASLTAASIEAYLRLKQSTSSVRISRIPFRDW